MIETDEPLDISLLNPPEVFEEMPKPMKAPTPALEYERNIRPLPVVPIKEPVPPRQLQPEAEFYTYLFVFARRLCFAIGLGMFGYGLGGKTDPGELMGWGLFLAGLCVPLGRK